MNDRSNIGGAGVIFRSVRAAGVLLFTLAFSSVGVMTAVSQTPPQGVFTYHNDPARTGVNVNETILTPARVTPTSFGKLFADPVDGQIYAQPLYVANVAIPGQGSHNVVYVATENDTVYAFNADAPRAPFWHTSLLTAAGGTAVPSADVSCDQITPLIGVTGTPVIDPATNTLYVVAMSKEGDPANPSYVQRLHALDITTGMEKFGGPVAITATVPGTGDGGDGLNITFDPLQQVNRPGLTLTNGVIYIAFGSHCDNSPYHGWLFAYDAGSLSLLAVFVTTPNASAGSIWQSGGSVAVDQGNSLYVMTGNGTFDADQPGGSDFGDSVLKLVQQGSALTVTDYFTPFDQASLDTGDIDLGSGGPVVLPDQNDSLIPRLLVGAGKEGTIYLLNRDSLGQYCSGCAADSQIVQALPSVLSQNFSTPAFWKNTVYFCAAGDVLKAFSIARGLLSTSPTSQAATGFGFPGATVSISANGTVGGIVWAVQTDGFGSGDPAVLHAYDATNVATELYNSTQAHGGRDTLGPAVKFAVPTIINGKVYVGTANELDVFGLRLLRLPPVPLFP